MPRLTGPSGLERRSPARGARVRARVWCGLFPSQLATSPPAPQDQGSPRCQTPAPSRPFAAPLARIPQARVSTPAPGPGRSLLREPIWVGCRLSGRMLRCTSDLPSHLAEQGSSSNQGLSIR
jgi:hypothetical protein